ncbi:adenosine deaminase [Fusobacterium sp. PH5-44]|uniref:adenosine deaminase n=1 Tax=unclassified Fusobacterium TaxID=2648384 RepID=UPI003D227069
MTDIIKSSKIDLHCHLDGSLSLETIKNIIPKIKLPNSDEEILKLLRVSKNSQNLSEYLEKFELPLIGLQNSYNIQLAAYNLIKDVALENIKYIEVRFAPILSTNDGLSISEVIYSVINGLKSGEKDFGVYTNCIVCAMRHDSFETNSKMLKIAKDFLGYGVCALDLAGDEIKFSTKNHIDLFKLANDMKFPFTIHSGETGNIENVALAIELGAKRLGHGIALAKDKNLMKLVKHKNIGIEMCPTSNIQTHAVENYHQYPMGLFLRNELLITANTDNRTVSNTTMIDELKIVDDLYQNEFPNIIQQLYYNAVTTSFADNSIKDTLIKLL